MKINNPARSPVKESDYFTMYVQILTGFHIHTYVNRVIMITMRPNNNKHVCTVMTTNRPVPSTRAHWDTLPHLT